MDILQCWNTTFFELGVILKFLKDYESEYGNNKKYIELKVSYFLAKFLAEEYKNTYILGFPTKTFELPSNITESAAIAIIKRIIDGKITLDEDFDTVIAPRNQAKKVYYRIQVVRFLAKAPNNTTDELFGFLSEKKFKIPKDKKLILLVSLEKDQTLNIGKNLVLNYIELNRKLKENTIPYGYIFILGQYVGVCKYFCCEVYPSAKKLKDFVF